MNEDFLERLHMADQDDDEDDLAQLKQLRQVWLAMPDEEPPSKGLDALMAAARTKAEEMKPAPWWKRMFAVMVTPPALALATVVVVAGGAVLVHNHRDEVEKHEQVELDGKTAAAPTEGVIAAQGSAAPTATPPADPRAAGGADGSRGEAEKREVVDPPKPKPVVATKKPAAHAGSKGGKGDSLFRGDDEMSDTLKLAERSAPPPPPPPPPPAQKAPVEKPVDRAPAKSMPDTGLDAPGAAAPTTPTSNSQSNAQPMAAQLLVKARAAAERNDCATVKQLLEQIAKLDGAYYRNTAAKDATVGRCMQIAD